MHILRGIVDAGKDTEAAPDSRGAVVPHAVAVPIVTIIDVRKSLRNRGRDSATAKERSHNELRHREHGELEAVVPIRGRRLLAAAGGEEAVGQERTTARRLVVQYDPRKVVFFRVVLPRVDLEHVNFVRHQRRDYLPPQQMAVTSAAARRRSFFNASRRKGAGGADTSSPQLERPIRWQASRRSLLLSTLGGRSSLSLLAAYSHRGSTRRRSG